MPDFIFNNLQMQTTKVRNLDDILLNILQQQKPAVFVSNKP